MKCYLLSMIESLSRPAKRLVSVVIFALLVGVHRGDANGESPNASWQKFQNGGHSVLAESDLPKTWSSDSNVLWQAEIQGYGQSSPIVSRKHVYVTSVSGDQRQQYHLSAFSLTQGSKLWQLDFDNPTLLKNTPMTSRAAPSAVADETGCIAFFEGGIIVAVDHSGKKRWQRNLIDEFGGVEARHGLSASLESNEHSIFAWVERSEQPYVLALNKQTGETLWKADGLGGTSWASPRLVSSGHGDHLVCSASGKIVGFDPSTGTRLWELTDVANNTSCTPVPIADGRFLIGASDGRGESGTGAAYNGVVQIRRDGEEYSAKYIWNAEKASCSFGSPIVAGGRAFIVSRAGVLYELDLETGKRLKTTRTSAGGIWATPIVAGDFLYLFGSKGTTSVISLSESKEIFVNQLWQSSGEGSSGGVLYAAAAVPPYLIIRRGETLFAISNAK